MRDNAKTSQRQTEFEMDSLPSESSWKTPEMASDGSRNESWTRDNFDLVFDVFIRENESFQTAVLEYLRKQVPK